MNYYTITLRLGGALSNAVAVEWTNQSASLGGEPGWEPCLRLVDGAWKFSSGKPFGAAPPHKRAPGAFGDLAIRYRLSAAGPWSEASATRKEVMIVEVTEESPTGDPLPVAPILAAAPVLAGSGKIGSEVTVTAGLWSGHPAPQISFQWRRAGAAIPGAVSRAYVPVPADDLTPLSCVVTARNGGGETVAITAAVAIVYPAPKIAGDLPDEIFDEDTGPQRVETDCVFLGENLAFTATGGAINPATGVLTVSTDQPVSGQIITITAANSGGKVSASVMITVEAAPPIALPAPAPFGASDVAIVRCDWRPVGQSVDFSPILSFPKLTPEQRATVQIQFRAGPLADTGAAWRSAAPLASESGRYWLPDSFDLSSAWPTVNLSIWQDNARRVDRLRFRHRFADNQEWSTDSSTINVPLPAEDPANPSVWAHTNTELFSFADKQMIHYKAIPWGTNGTDGPGTNRPFGVHMPVNYALCALAGSAQVIPTAAPGGSWDGVTTLGYAANTTPAQRLLAQLRFWGNASQTMPRGSAGYACQYEISFVCAVAIARLIPAIWDALTATEKTRLRLGMKACLLGAAFQNSDWHDRSGVDTGASYGAPWTTNWGKGNNRTVRGQSAGRNSNLNYSTPPKFVPLIVAQFMAKDGENAQTWMNNYTRADFVAQLTAAGGLNDALDTYKQTWTLAVNQAFHKNVEGGGAYGEGPTEAQLKRALSGGSSGVWRAEGRTITQVRETLVAEIEKMFSRRIQPGPQVVFGDGTSLPGRETGPGWTTAHGYKDATHTKGVLRACLGKRISATNNQTDKSAWAGIPNPGQMHRAFELDTTDGANYGGIKIRAAMSYTHQGVAALFMAACTLSAYGAFSKTGLEIAALRNKINVGIEDLNYIDKNGWRSYAKGGTNTSGETISNNEDWTEEMAEDAGYLLKAEAALSRTFNNWMKLA